MDVLVANVSDVNDLAKQGKARVLGVMSAERAPSLPDVATFKESGYDLIAGTARGYSAPAGLPDAVAKKLEAALEKAIQDPAVVQKMKDLGLETSYLNGSDYEKFWAGQEEDFKTALPLVQKTN